MSRPRAALEWSKKQIWKTKKSLRGGHDRLARGWSPIGGFMGVRRILKIPKHAKVKRFERWFVWLALDSWARMGVGSLGEFRMQLDAALAKKGISKFGDLPRRLEDVSYADEGALRVPLRIVAIDVRSRSIVVFGDEDWARAWARRMFASLRAIEGASIPELRLAEPSETLLRRAVEAWMAVGVADAVCASCSLPFAFEPYVMTVPVGFRIEGGKLEIAQDRTRFVDGGISANLPAWTFAAERDHYAKKSGRRLPILGVQFDDRPNARFGEPPGMYGHIKDLVATTLTAGQDVANGLIDELATARIALAPSPECLDTTDFPLMGNSGFVRPSDPVVATLNAGWWAIQTGVKRHYFLNDPDSVNKALEACLRSVTAYLLGSRDDDTTGGQRFRLNVILRVSERTLRIRYSAGMFDKVGEDVKLHPDIGMTLLLHHSNAGRVMLQRTALYSRADDVLLGKGHYEPAVATREQVWPALVGILSFPLFDPDELKQPDTPKPEPIGVLTLDANFDFFPLLRAKCGFEERGGGSINFTPEAFLASELGQMYRFVGALVAGPLRN